ncbi:MAG: LysM peptidoglycan-binding domain-containing protein [Pseudomonadales bacterium]|nr:LysM peptidoglycan-binding domain-containing protein [Pseudomonadales bacterium]
MAAAESNTVVQSYTSLWESTAQRFGETADFLAPIGSKAIVEEINWLKRNRSYLERVTRRSEPYAYHIVQRCKERGLPLELALVPMIESAYDAFAYSPGRATGLWQFIPATGRHYKLEQNWWYDGRRDVLASTEAALDYLSYLHNRFDDWLLALAAYNGGPARVSRAIRKNRKAGLQTDYWSLRLPTETSRYVPRLLALRAVLSDPQHYGKAIWPVANAPHFEIVELDSQIDLAQAAKMAGIEMRALYKLNPGFSRWATPPEGPHQLLLPVENAGRFASELEKTNSADRLKWHRYVVKTGDTLSGIAKKFSSRHQLIARANNIQAHRIRAGQALLVPVASESSAHYVLSEDQRQLALGSRYRGREKSWYTVKPGDSWWKIGKRYNVSSATLARWNGKAAGDTLLPGKRLVVWRKAASKNSGRATVSRSFTYRVRQGDSLSRIASHYNVSVSELLDWNDLAPKEYLRPGQPLKVKVAVAGNN